MRTAIIAFICAMVLYLILAIYFCNKAQADVLTPDYWTETEKLMEGC